MNLQPHPLPEFQVACEVFRGAAETSNRAARALVCCPCIFVPLDR